MLIAINDATITFASTLPVNTFSGNTAPNNNYGNCYKDSGAHNYYKYGCCATVTGSCS